MLEVREVDLFRLRLYDPSDLQVALTSILQDMDGSYKSLLS